MLEKIGILIDKSIRQSKKRSGKEHTAVSGGTSFLLTLIQCYEGSLPKKSVEILFDKKHLLFFKERMKEASRIELQVWKEYGEIKFHLDFFKNSKNRFFSMSPVFLKNKLSGVGMAWHIYEGPNIERLIILR